MRALFLATLLLAGCIKPTPVQQALRPEPVLVGTTLTSSEQSGTLEVPSQVQERLTEELKMRGLVPVLTGDSEHQLTIDVSARFSTQVNGRYRWNVLTQMTLVPGSEPSAARTTELNTAVALVYSHQGEQEALTEAAPLIARQLGALLDAWIADGA